ncbi:MAG TPA: GNAT family N-acetyltransferase [Caulobacteraceae bacterium]|nr:GNAT family N-acetyltransferase [Caulobacteraceae bacterium]
MTAPTAAVKGRVMREVLTLRAMRPDEIDAVAQLWWRSSVSAAPAGSDHPSWLEMAERLRHERWSVTVGMRGRELAGMLAIEAESRWLRQLFVDPAAQSEGVGTALLEEARRLLPTGFHLHTNADNRLARAFYEARGLRPAGERRHRLGGLQVRYEWAPTSQAVQES